VSNVVADALSRRDVEATAVVSALSAPPFTIFNNMCTEFTASPEAAQLLEEVIAGAHDKGCHIIDGLVMCRGRVYVSPTSPSLPEVLATAQDLGHEGIEKTLHWLRTDFHVLGAHAIVCDFVQECPGMSGVPEQQNRTTPPGGSLATPGCSYNNVG
jgi:hypothetical protein